MLPFTKSDSIYLSSALVADNDVQKVLEPATGAVSLEANSYEEFVVEVTLNNLVASAPNISVQFYENDTADGDVSATWTAVGVLPATAPLTKAGAAAIAGQTLSVKLHSRNISKRYVTAIATVNFADQGVTGTYVSATLRGELARRDV